MGSGLILGGAVLISFIVLTIRGDKKVKDKKKIFEEIKLKMKISAEILAFLSYHGGVPLIPKPQKLNVALADDGLLLFTNQGASGKIDFSCCKKVEKFSTRKNPDLKGKSIVLWGPFVGLFLRPKIRHFIVVKYKDMRGLENNLLLEAGDNKELESVFRKIYNGYNTNLLSEPH